jgi:hypothetical protein
MLREATENGGGLPGLGGDGGFPGFRGGPAALPQLGGPGSGGNIPAAFGGNKGKKPKRKK